MADNIQLNSATSTGDKVAADDISGVKYQIVKPAFGAADVAPTVVTSSAGLPVDIASSTIDVMLGTDFSGVLGASNIVATDGSTALTLGLHACGTDGTNAQILSTSTSGVLNVHAAPHTSGGLDIMRTTSLVATAQAIKASAGQIFGWTIHNEAATVNYVKFYNIAAASVTVGTSAIAFTIPLRPDTVYTYHCSEGIAFDTAISVAATTLLADNDNTAPTASDVQVNIFYK